MSSAAAQPTPEFSRPFDDGAGDVDARAARAARQRMRIAAAKARVTADKKRGATTEQWIVDLANKTR